MVKAAQEREKVWDKKVAAGSRRRKVNTVRALMYCHLNILSYLEALRITDIYHGYEITDIVWFELFRCTF
jgi:hypothetical protein